jgi:Flp pilus assembly pilin Flp
MAPTNPRWLRDTRGASLVEYLVLVGLVALFAIAGVRAFGSSTETKVSAHAACIVSLSCADGAPEATAALTSTVSGTGDAPAPLVAEDSGGSKGIGSRIWDFGKGFVLQAWDTVKGLAHVVMHPIETAKGLWSAITHPVATYHAIKDALVEAWHENPDEFVGRAVFEVVTLPLSVAKVSKVKLATATKVVDKADGASDAAKLGDNAAAVAALKREVDADPARAAEAERARALAAETPVGVLSDGAAALRRELLPLAMPEATRPALMAAIRSDLATNTAKTADFIAANPETKFKRVIIGGGPQGQTIANALHRAGDGTSTLIVDATKGDQNFGSIRNFDLNSKGPDSPLYDSPIQVSDLTSREYPNAGTFGDASTIGLYSAMRQGTDVLTDTKAAIVDGTGKGWPGRYRIDMVDGQGRPLSVYTDEVVTSTGLGKPVGPKDPASKALADAEAAKVAADPSALPDVRITSGEDLLRGSNFVADQAAFYRASDGPIYFIGAGDAAKTAVEHFGDVTKGGPRPEAFWVGIKDEDLWSRYAKAKELVDSGAVTPATGRLSKIEEIPGTNKLQLTFDTPNGPVTKEAGKVVMSIGMQSDVPNLMKGVVDDFDPKVHLETVTGVDTRYPDQSLAKRVAGHDVYVAGIATNLGRKEGVSWLEYYGWKNTQLVEQVLAKGPKQPSPIPGTTRGTPQP